jgi:hypothetical protein
MNSPIEEYRLCHQCHIVRSNRQYTAYEWNKPLSICLCCTPTSQLAQLSSQILPLASSFSSSSSSSSSSSLSSSTTPSSDIDPYISACFDRFIPMFTSILLPSSSSSSSSPSSDSASSSYPQCEIFIAKHISRAHIYRIKCAIAVKIPFYK